MIRALAAALLLIAAAPAAAGDEARGAALAAARGCGACHGAIGQSPSPGVPSLAAHPAEFVTLQLILFRERLRDVPPMTALAEGLTDLQIEDLAAYYAGLAPAPARDAAVAEPAAAALIGRLNCGVCHLSDFRGRAQIPRIAGQREDYLVHALTQYRDGRRVGTDTNMNAVMHGVDDADIALLARTLAGANR